MSRHSPDGYMLIEECNICSQRWEHNPSIGYPVTLCTMAELNRRREAFERNVINEVARAALGCD